MPGDAGNEAERIGVKAQFGDQQIEDRRAGMLAPAVGVDAPQHRSLRHAPARAHRAASVPAAVQARGSSSNGPPAQLLVPARLGLRRAFQRGITDVQTQG